MILKIIQQPSTNSTNGICVERVNVKDFNDAQIKAVERYLKYPEPVFKSGIKQPGYRIYLYIKSKICDYDFLESDLIIMSKFICNNSRFCIIRYKE